MNDPTPPTSTKARRGRPPSARQAGDAGAATTASSGNNAHRRTQKRTLSGRIGAMERKLDQQGELLKSIARGVS